MSGRVPVKRVPKPWGYEIIWAHTDRYVGKVLHINAGHALSVQYHNHKDETVYLLSGEMKYWVKLGAELEDVRLSRATRSASRRARCTTWKRSPTATSSKRPRRSSTTSCGSRTGTDARGRRAP